MFEENSNDFDNFSSPLMIDQQIRSAAQLCWIMLPSEKKTTDNLREELIRIIDRICNDMDEDLRHFNC